MQTNSRIHRRYGWQPDLPDHRDLLYSTIKPKGVRLPSAVDLRAGCSPVEDQGELGSCTANATAACFQYDSILDGKDCGELSRLWIYYFERQLEHTLDQGDCGAMGHDAFTVAKRGIPDERKWPYDIAKFEAKPPDAEPRAYTLRKTVKSVPQTETAIKQVLSNRQTIAFGFTVYESFESPEVAKTGIVPMPTRGEKTLGGHEVLLVGYLKDSFGTFTAGNHYWITILPPAGSHRPRRSPAWSE